MSKDINQDIIPPIFKWAESLSTNLSKLQDEIKSDATKLEKYHRQHKHENSIKSPSSPRSPNTIKSSRATLLSPISTVRSPSSIHSARNANTNANGANTTHQTVISFEPTANTLENVNKMFNDLPESIHYTANKVTSDGERIMADVAKKIWGNDVPKTFLTALDLEIPIITEEDDLDDYASSAYLTYSSRFPSKLSTERRSITLPALEVQKEQIPKNLKTHNLGFPNKTNPDEIIPQIMETTEFESIQQRNAFEKITLCDSSLDIISDGFWWFLMNEWKGDKEKDTQQIVFNRMSKNYVNLFLSAPQRYKDVIFDNYYDVLSQSIFTCFVQQYPKSKALFTNKMKSKILHITSKWTMGCIPSSLSFKHWYVPIRPHQNKKRLKKQQQVVQDKEEMSGNMIPTKVVRKDVVFEHSEFVQYYLKNEAKVQIGEKLKFKLNMTFCKPSTEKAMFQELSEETLQRNQQSEAARMKLVNAQKELTKMIRIDGAMHKENANEVQQQMFVAKRNKKEFVSNILKQLLPNQVEDLG